MLKKVKEKKDNFPRKSMQTSDRYGCHFLAGGDASTAEVLLRPGQPNEPDPLQAPVVHYD